MTYQDCEPEQHSFSYQSQQQFYDLIFFQGYLLRAKHFFPYEMTLNRSLIFIHKSTQDRHIKEDYKIMLHILELINLRAVLYLALLAFVLLLYNTVILPYFRFIRRRQQLQGKYKIYSYPFRPLGFSFMKQILEDFKQYGDSIHVRKHQFPKNDITLATIQGRVIVTLVNNQLVHQFYEKHKEGYYKKTNGGLGFLSFKQILGDGLLLSEGQQWRYKRKVMGDLFNYEFIKTKFKTIVEICQEKCYQVKSTKGDDGTIIFQVGSLFQEIAGSIVLRCFFGDTKLELINGKSIFCFLNDLLSKNTNRNLRVSSFLFGAILMKYGIRKIDREISEESTLFRTYVKQTIRKIISELNKEECGKSEGLIAKLFREKKLVEDCSFEQKVSNGYYTHADLANQMATFFFAGTETTSNGLCSLICKLTERPDVEAKLRKEISEVLKDDIANITLDNLKKMNYLRYCQSEILRLFPPVPLLMTRQAVSDHMIGQIKIRKGDFVNMEVASNHYNENIFENPFEFVPERWQKLENMPSTYRNYLPFSLGARVCIGQQLALIEGRVALIMLLMNFKNGKLLQPTRHRGIAIYGPENTRMVFQTN